MTNQPERLNKVLAELGLGSRRSVDKLIESGSVFVNNVQATLGQKVSPGDGITVEGKNIVRKPTEKIIITFNKPAGVTTTKSDPFAKVTVMDYLPKQLQHLYPVGRLDKNSRGLLLLTNDGDLALQLEHPRYNHEKEYVVHFKATVKKSIESFHQDMHRLSHEIVAKHAQSKPITINHPHFMPATQSGEANIILTEGKKRQIRELFREIGYFVTDLQRIRIGRVTLDDLKEGEYRIVDSKLLNQ